MKKNNCLFTLLLVFVTGPASAQLSGKSCENFKTGQYSYRDSSTNQIWDIKRTHNHQVESNKSTGASIRYRIKWTGDCSYKLTQLYASTKELRKKNNSWVEYEIVSGSESSYSFRCKCSDGSVTGGMVVKMW